MKRICTLLTALIMVVSMLPVAIAEDVVTYTGFTVQRADGHTYMDSLAIQTTLEEAGIAFDLTSVPSSMYAEKRNLLLNGGSYPDFFLGTDVDVEWYGAQEGILMPLEDLIAEYAPNIKAYIDKMDAWEFLSCTDGHVYAIPRFTKAYARDELLWVNKTWLENLGLEMPKSLEDVKNVLIAFKEQDANGNDDPNDEIPLLSTDSDFIHFFNYYEWKFNYEFRLVVRDDGNVDFLPLTEEFKELTAYVTDLYQNDLINDDCFTMTEQSGAALAQTTDTVGMFFDSWGTGLLPGEKLYDYCIVTPWCDSVEVSNGILRNAFVITDACKQPEKLIAWLDQFYTEEGSNLINLGVQGQTYDIDENGNWYYLTSEEQNIDYIRNVLAATGMPTYESDFFLYNDAGSDPITAYSLQQLGDASSHAGLAMLPLNFTDEDLQIGLPIMIDVNTYFPQYMANVMTGQLDLQASWPEFQQMLLNMQAPVLEEVLQGCYDRLEN